MNFPETRCRALIDENISQTRRGQGWGGHHGGAVHRPTVDFTSLLIVQVRIFWGAISLLFRVIWLP